MITVGLSFICGRVPVSANCSPKGCRGELDALGSAHCEPTSFQRARGIGVEEMSHIRLADDMTVDIALAPKVLHQSMNKRDKRTHAGPLTKITAPRVLNRCNRVIVAIEVPRSPGLTGTLTTA